jgi:hypothetical protein
MRSLLGLIFILLLSMATNGCANSGGRATSAPTVGGYIDIGARTHF